MAVALVGSRGAASQGAASAAVTPAWGASETRAAGNLLICTVAVTKSATLPTTPAGWAIAKQVAGTSTSATIYYRTAEGGDAAPTINGITSGLIAAQLSEYSGVIADVVDQSGSATGTTSPNTATAGGANAATGELIIMASGDTRSVNRATNDTWTSNDGTVTLAGSNNGTSSQSHYSFGAIVGSTATTAQTSVVTLSITTSITGIANVNASFKLGLTDVNTLPAAAVIQRAQAGNLTAAAIIREPQSGSLTADAFLVVTHSGSLTTAAVIRGVEAGSLATDAVIETAGSGGFTVDAVLGISGHSFTADATIAPPTSPPSTNQHPRDDTYHTNTDDDTIVLLSGAIGGQDTWASLHDVLVEIHGRISTLEATNS